MLTTDCTQTCGLQYIAIHVWDSYLLSLNAYKKVRNGNDNFSHEYFDWSSNQSIVEIKAGRPSSPAHIDRWIFVIRARLDAERHCGNTSAAAVGN